MPTYRQGRLARRERRRSVSVNARAKDLSGFGAERQQKKEWAPQVGLEPTTLRLTAGLSAAAWLPFQ
jgi:hypothetical protein